jgi:hypothetical protein
LVGPLVPLPVQECGWIYRTNLKGAIKKGGIS